MFRHVQLHPRKAIGESEDGLCKQCGVSLFSELKLGLNYGSFVSQHVPCPAQAVMTKPHLNPI